MASQRTILSRSSKMEPRQSGATGTGCDGTRRGKRLTSAHHKALLDLYISNQSDKMFMNHTKRFWRHISALLIQKTGRIYSWQSCRRQVTKWESQQSHAQSISGETDAAPGLQFEVPSPRRLHHRIVLPPISQLNLGISWPEREPPLEESSDDGMLPALNLPPVRTRSHQSSTSETCHMALNSSILTAMHNLEMQLQVLTSTLAEQNVHALAIESAFQNLQHEILNLSGKHDYGSQLTSKRKAGTSAED